MNENVDDAAVVTDATAEHALTEVLRRGFAIERDARAVIADAVRRGERRPSSWIDLVAVRELERQLQTSPKHEATHARLAAFDIPLADHPLVDAYIEYFTGRGRQHFAKWLGRLERYRPLMQPVLVDKGLPKDLIFVALIESGLAAGATSTAAACGFWQFIRSTGAMYGMRMDFWVDERRDFIRATEAAATYLKALHREFGDWHLAWASYNAGAGRVRRAMARYGTPDYWALVANEKSLAKETRHYVPKVIAAAIIAKDPARYGFTDIVAQSPLAWESVAVEDATDLRVVARHAGVELDSLRDLNPALLHDVTPPGRRYLLRVPVGHGDTIATWLHALPASDRLTYLSHTVQKGDTLSGIAQRYGSTVNAISEFNRIKNARALRLGQSLIIPTVRRANVVGTPVARSSDTSPVREQVKTAAAAKAPARATTSRGSGRPTTSKSARTVATRRQHVVRRGETLWSIAMRYGIAVDELKHRNGRASNGVMAGERLTIF